MIPDAAYIRLDCLCIGLCVRAFPYLLTPINFCVTDSFWRKENFGKLMKIRKMKYIKGCKYIP